MRRIGNQPQAKWFATWDHEIRTAVDTALTTITSSGALPVLVAYASPNRDCGSYAAGGAPSADEYRRWIRGFAEGIGSRKAVVILEPDALAETDCLSEAELAQRFALLREAISTLKANPRTFVYLDAGNPLWMEPERIAERMRSAGIASADGFALNISNFQTTADNIAYGSAISELVGKRFVIDTSRNGLGPSVPYEWCNPPGRGLGDTPTTDVDHPLVDALLWIKWPGESDGECSGGPAAGAWWPEYALGLARRAPPQRKSGAAL